MDAQHPLSILCKRWIDGAAFPFHDWIHERMAYFGKVKICGLTSEADLQLAARAGADYFGFIAYAGSPRWIAPAQAARWFAQVSADRRVYVDVAPAPERLTEARALGFSRFQIHFDPSTDLAVVGQWSAAVGADALWLAPRLAPGESFRDVWLEFAETFLLDAYSPTQVGGTGQTGDWEQFRSLRRQTPGKTWILAGGLSPETVCAAITATGARFIDVNSGVEASPGHKAPDKVVRLFEQLQHCGDADPG